MSLTPFAFWPLVHHSAFRTFPTWNIEVYQLTETYHAKRTQEFLTEAEATAYVARFKDTYPETTGVECTMQPKTTRSTKVTVEPTELGLKVALAAEAAQDDISY